MNVSLAFLPKALKAQTHRTLTAKSSVHFRIQTCSSVFPDKPVQQHGKYIIPLSQHLWKQCKSFQDDSEFSIQNTLPKMTKSTRLSRGEQVPKGERGKILTEKSQSHLGLVGTWIAMCGIPVRHFGEMDDPRIKPSGVKHSRGSVSPAPLSSDVLRRSVTDRGRKNLWACRNLFYKLCFAHPPSQLLINSSAVGTCSLSVR